MMSGWPRLLPITLLVALAAPAPARPQARSDSAGDPLPHGTLLRLGTLRWRTDGHPQGTTYLPDGKTLVTASGSNLVQWWDARDGRELRRAVLERGLSSNLAAARRAPLLAAGGLAVQLIDADRGTVRPLLDGPLERATSVALSPDGKLVAASNHTETRLWDTATGKLLHRIPEHTLPRSPSAFAPDGKTLALLPRMDRTGIVLFDVAVGRPARTLVDPGKKLYSTAAFAPDGKTLATAHNDGSPVTLWHLASGKPVRRLATGLKGVMELDFTDDGATLAAMCHTAGSVVLWDVTTGEVKARLDGGWFALAPGARSVALCRPDHTIEVADAVTGRGTVRRAGHGRPLTGLAFAPDGRTLATVAQEPGVRLWDARSGKELAWLHEPSAKPSPWNAGGAAAVAFSPDGKRLAVAGSPAEVWDVAARRREREIASEVFSSVGASAFADGGKALALARHRAGITGSGSDGRMTLSLRDLGAGRELRQREAQALGVTASAFSADGRHFAWANWEGKVHVWPTDGQAGVELAGAPQGGTHGLAFSHEGRLVACAQPDEIVLWDWAARRRLITLKGSGKMFSRLTFSPDGRFLVEGAHDGRLRSWAALSGAVIHTFAAHRHWISCLAFAPDGRRLATGSLDSTALLWDVWAILGKPERPLAPEAAEVERLWEDLGSAEAAKAYRALWALATVPARAVALAKERLRPVSAERVRGLVAKLDSKRFADREEAQRGLEALGREIEPLVREPRDPPAEEARRRLRQLIERVENLPVTADTLRALRAVDLLEAVATAEARAVLDSLAAGAAGAMRTESARAALARLKGVR